MIGFGFTSSFLLRQLQVTYFDCPIWGAGVTTINVYSSFGFPTFSTAASTNIGVLSLVGDSSPSCTSIRKFTIPVRTTESMDIYFLQFSFAGGSSVNPLNWLHLGEIRFSDASLTTTTTIGIPTTSTPRVTTTTGDNHFHTDYNSMCHN